VLSLYTTGEINVSIERISVENKQELERMITKEMGQIEKGLTVICTRVPVNDKTTLDILCHDSNGQLVVIQLNVKEDNNMLIQGMQSLEYVNRFKSFLKATYHKHKIDDKEKPRLIMIAPSFSETLRRVVENIQGIRIDLYEWEYLKLGDHKGLKLQPIFVRKPVEKPKEKREEAKPAEKKKEPKPTKKKEEPELPKEEIPEPPPPEKPKVEPEEPKPEEKEEPPKRKLRLF
jgi:hypothetical protein